LDLGFYVSFSGIITFKKAHELREVVKQVPLDRILVETDAPFLTPEPHRGKTNEPAFVKHVAERMAEVRGLSFEEICDITTRNAKRFFGI
jgi:TatD DNase family protein